jgi:hypothetical protein
MTEVMRMNKRFALSIVLFCTMALSVVAAAAVFAAGLLKQPEPRGLPIVRVADMREGEPVRAVGSDSASAYILLSGHVIIAYSARAPTINRCSLEWQAEKRLFFDDGCVGAQFDATGRWIAGPALRDLDRHPVIIRDGWVVVDTRTLIPGRDLWTNAQRAPW